MSSSIKLRLLWSVLVTVLIALMLNSLLAHVVARHEVDEIFDAELLSTARIIRGVIDQPTLAQQSDRIRASVEQTLSDTEVMPPELKIYEKKILLQVWDRRTDDILFRSSNAPDYALAPLRKGFYYHDKGDDHWIVYVTDLPQADAWLLLGEIPSARNELGNSLIAVFIVSGALALIIASLMAMSSIDFGLASLAELRSLLRHRSVDNLEALDIHPMPVELAPVVSGMNQLFQRIHDGMESEKRFVADASHELRTPLAVMKLRAQKLAEQVTDPELRHELHALEASVSRSHRVVEQLLLLARIDSGELSNSQPGMTDVAEQIRRTLAEVWPQADRHNIQLAFSEEPVQAMPLQSTLLDIALRNLLDNAIRYSPAGGRIDVRLSRSESGQHIAIIIEDQGPGVDQALLPSLDKRFFRAAGQNITGSGLGLSIVRRVCEQMNAQLSLTNCNGGGFRSTIHLPVPETHDVGADLT